MFIHVGIYICVCLGFMVEIYFLILCIFSFSHISRNLIKQKLSLVTQVNCFVQYCHKKFFHSNLVLISVDISTD